MYLLKTNVENYYSKDKVEISLLYDANTIVEYIEEKKYSWNSHIAHNRKPRIQEFLSIFEFEEICDNDIDNFKQLMNKEYLIKMIEQFPKKRNGELYTNAKQTIYTLSAAEFYDTHNPSWLVDEIILQPKDSKTLELIIRTKCIK